jgi:hypothetical protein
MLYDCTCDVSFEHALLQEDCVCQNGLSGSRGVFPGKESYGFAGVCLICTRDQILSG